MRGAGADVWVAWSGDGEVGMADGIRIAGEGEGGESGSDFELSCLRKGGGTGVFASSLKSRFSRV